MTDAEPDKATDWLAVLRPADLKPPLYIKGPEHFPHVLKAFGPLSPFEFRRAVFAIDEIVTGYLSARNRKPPMKFEEADKLLDQIETSFAKSLAAWERAAPLHEAMLAALIITTAPDQRPANEFWGKIAPTSPLKNALLGVRALRNPNVYRDATTGQPSQKKPERELLWEKLFMVLSQFGLHAPFNKHQQLMRTVRALHSVIGIDPPDANAFKQAIRAWRG